MYHYKNPLQYYWAMKKKKIDVPIDSNSIGYWMSRALSLARQAYLADEVPVGAVLVLPGGQVVEQRNRIRAYKDPTAHAEILCIQDAAKILANERVRGVLITTLEPCPMCAGAALLGRLDAIVFGAFDPKSGACGSTCQICQPVHHSANFKNPFNHSIALWPGFMEQAYKNILQDFFKNKRKNMGKSRF